MIFKEKRTFKEFWLCLNIILSYTLEMFGNILTGLWLFFSLFESILWTGVISALFSRDGYEEVLIQQLIFENMKSSNISEFSFIILVGISVFCVALLMLRLFSFLRISSFWTFLNEKWDLELQNFLIATMLGWFRYLAIAFRSASFIFSEIGSSTLYCWMSRFWTIFEKKAFKTSAVFFFQF